MNKMIQPRKPAGDEWWAMGTFSRNFNFIFIIIYAIFCFARKILLIKKKKKAANELQSSGCSSFCNWNSSRDCHRLTLLYISYMATQWHLAESCLSLFAFVSNSALKSIIAVFFFSYVLLDLISKVKYFCKAHSIVTCECVFKIT